MKIDSESLLVDTLSDRPKVAPPSAVISEEVVIGIRGPNADRKLLTTHNAAPLACSLYFSVKPLFHASIVAKDRLTGIAISCCPTFRNEDPLSSSTSLGDFL
tara:strand:+ start:1657 stop:1962 length:306 start_codon:yes stop_codon:yes gene_type:complete